MRKYKVIYIALMTMVFMGLFSSSLMAAVIVDNSDTGFSVVGTWGTAAGDPDWGLDYRFHETGTGTNIATWSADLAAGNYNVYAWWVTYENRATNSPYTIDYDTGSETVRVCQKICNGRWVYLGNYSFDGASSVSLSDDADEYVIADAIKFDSGAPDNPYPIIDTNYIRFAGPSGWGGSPTVGYNGDQAWHVTGTGSNTATWTTNIPSAGNYNVYAWWTASDNRGTNVPYTINYEGGSKTVRVCQEIAGDQWVYLGNYPFTVGAYSVVLSDDADEYVIADAVKFAPGVPDNPYPIVDTNYIRFEGSGWEGSTTVGYNDDQAWHATGTGSNTATWTTNIPAPGNYNVYAWWMASDNRATNATYTINYGTGQSEDVMVCQELAGSQWVFLGNYSFNAGAYSVVLSDNADEYVMADAVKFEPGSPPANPHPIVDTEHIRFEGSGWHGATTTGYDDDIAWHAAGTGSNTATWRTDIPVAGNYNVYAWWTEYSNRATNAPYTINYEGGSETVRVCQEISGSQWVYLGNYPFAVGTYSVVLSDDADEDVYADAIKFELGSPDNPHPVADTEYIRFEGSGWHGATTGGYNDDFAHHVAGSGLNKTTWTTDITLAGNHDVWAWWTEYTDRATNAPYTVYYEGGSETVYKNQKTDGGQWVLLGNYNFNVGTYKVELTDNADGRVVADVIWWDNTGDNDEGGTGDGMRDGWELFYGLDPTVDDSTEDEDNDGLNNLGEFQNGTDPTEPDADGDGLLDGGEISNGTDPFDPDTDDDGLSDGWEVAHGFNPLVDDSDQAKIWDNDSTDGLWSTANNWSGNSIPEAGDVVVFNSTSIDDCTGGHITNNLQHILFDFGYSGALTIKQDSIDGGDTWTVSGDITVNEGNIICEGDPSVGNGEGITINASNIALAPGGTIHADGQGFGAGAGPGTAPNAGTCSGGAGHGGRGTEGRDSLGGPTYGSVDQPTALGSGGGGVGTAGAGGGAIKLNVANTLTVNGTISANGANGTGNYAGGSGGSIWLICSTFAGAGSINADGGDAGSTLDGGSSGGRISLEWTSGNRTFSGTISAGGGLGYRSQYGRPGTIYVPAGLWNELYNTTCPVNGSVALVPGTYNITTLHVTNNAVLSCQGDDDGDPVDGSGVIINSDNITIDTGAMISADLEGFLHNTGPGTAPNAGTCSGGAGYGGRGVEGRDSLGGPTYGSVDQPIALGSGGGGGNAGSGGGAIKLNVANTLTVNGTISAKGAQGIGNYPGGSGGSIWLICSTFAGAGSINADGGDAGTTLDGGGGGGRISLEWTSGNRTFSGTISAGGGLGYRSEYGRPGTIYVPAGLWNELFNATYPVNGSVALVPGTYNITTLHVTNNAVLSCQGDDDGEPVDGSGVVINSDSITVDYGAEISATGEGFLHEAGPGKSVDAGDCSGGAGYGGRGGDGRDSVGGPTYGTIYEPTALGSGGGGNLAGKGGGALKLVVTNTLTVDGSISANGASGLGNFAGGSGGSIWLVCGTLAGAGFITADGGNGGNTTFPGGGGGGRIHISRTTWTYGGVVTAFGGTGRNSGEYGTTYYDNAFLDWTDEANYESDGLDPEWGKATVTTFTYRIKYTHMYNKAPSAVYVYILKDGSEITGSPFTMSEVDSGDTTYDDGKLYYCEHIFATKGIYTYYFGAETPSCGPGIGDGSSESTGPDVVGFYVAQNLNKTPPDDWYETIQLALDDANPGDTIQLDLGLRHHEQVVIPSGVTLTGDTADPTGTTLTLDSPPVVSFAAASSGSALTGLTIRYTGENLTREATARHYYVAIGDEASNITIDKCLIGRDGYVSGWSSSNSRFLATTTFNDSGIYVGADASNVTITNCKIRYLTGPGVAVGDGGNDNITISNNHIYRNILPYDLRVDPYFEAPGIGLNGTGRANINFNEIYENNVGIGAQDLNGTDGTEGTVHIEGNIIHHNNRAGIGLNTQVGGTYFKSTDIVGNEIYSNGSAKNMGAVRIRYAYDVKLRQNHIHDNVYMGTYLDHVYDFEIYNNNIYRNYWNVRLAYVGKNENDQSFFYKNIVDPMGNVRGLYMTRGSDITLSSNIFRNADCFGAFFDTQSGPIDFRHNKACNNGRPGLRVRGALSGNMFKNLVVSNGEIYASKGAGVRFEVNASGDLEIYNNTFADNRRAGLSFEGGLTTSTYSLFYNIFAFNTLAGYKYGGTAWNPIDRWDWVDKHENFFFWNYGSYCDSPDRRDRRKMVYSQWGGPGGSGTDDITMYDAHINCDEYAWDFTNDPDDPYSLDPLDVTGLLNLANGEAGGAYSSYSGRSASYIEPAPATTPASDPYVEPPAEAPPEVAAVPEPFLG